VKFAVKGAAQSNPQLWKTQMTHVGTTPTRPGLGEDMPIAHATVISGEMEKIEPSVRLDKGRTIFTGSELMGDVSLPPNSVAPSGMVVRGSSLAVFPLNPLFCDGMRVAKTLAQYDQFKITRLTVEYVPYAPTTQSGGLIMAIVNDPADIVTLRAGFDSMRDLMSRPGSVSLPVYKNAAAGLGSPLLEWYYTATNDDASLFLPGMFVLMAGMDMPAAAAALPLGLLWMHYELEVRAPTIERPTAQTYSVPSATVLWSAAQAVDAYVELGSAIMPAAHQGYDSVGWGTIVGVTDNTAPAAWRIWRSVGSGEVVTVSHGTVLFWRVYGVAGTPKVYFYPSLYEALRDDYGQGGFQYTNATTAINRDLRFYNIMGTKVGGED